MKSIPVPSGRRVVLSALCMIALAVTLPALGARAAAQEQPAGASPDRRSDTGTYQTFYFHYVTTFTDAEEILTDLRNVLPHARIYLVLSQHAVSVEGTAEELQTVQKVLADIDRPRATYRLTYSIAEMDGNTAVSTRKVSLLVSTSGDKTAFKQGSKVPIITASSPTDPNAKESPAPTNQVQYEDVGLAIEASLGGSPDFLGLTTRVSQSSISSEHTSGNTGDPAIQQSVLDVSATLVPGKLLVLGTVDIPGTGHREEISVTTELVH